MVFVWGFRILDFLFFMRWVFSIRDELSITELWDVRREELGVGDLSRIWWRAWKSHRTPCALQAGGSTWLKFIRSPWRCCISPGCAWVVSCRMEGERLEHSEAPMEHVPVLPPAPNAAPKHPKHPPEVWREDGCCRAELCQQKTPGFAAEPREVVATIPGGIAEVCGRGAEGPWQCCFMAGFDLKGFFQPEQFWDSADKHWVGWFGKLRFVYFSSGHQTQLFSLWEWSMPNTISVCKTPHFIFVSLFVSSFFTDLPGDQAHMSYMWQLQLSADTKDDWWSNSKPHILTTNLNKQRPVWQLNIKSYKTFLGVHGLNQFTKMNFQREKKKKNNFLRTEEKWTQVNEIEPSSSSRLKPSWGMKNCNFKGPSSVHEETQYLWILGRQLEAVKEQKSL